MSARLHVPLLVFIALGTLAMDTRKPPDSDAAAPGRTRRIELVPEPSLVLPELAIQPSAAILVMFDAPLARDGMELEGRERFQRVVVGEDTVALVPSEALREGERLRLTVRFEEGVSPAEARFLLVVARDRADRQVEVVRPRSASVPDPRTLSELAEEIQRLREENARLRMEQGASGLTGVITSPWMRDHGITEKLLARSDARITGAALQAEGETVRSFRASARIAVKVSVRFSPNEPDWSMGSAALIGPAGLRPRIVQVWQSGSTAGGVSGVDLIVEAESDKKGPLGTYTLELYEAGGARTLTVFPVTFPDR